MISEVAVVMDDSSSVTSRRLRMLEADEGDADLARRCSITPGVCYHTMAEMRHLHRLARASGSGRQLVDTVEDDDVDGGQLTYAEINADLAILSVDSRSSLTQASSFLSGLLDANLTTAADGTTSIFFVMKERCVNYAGLADTCNSAPAPTVSSATADQDVNNTVEEQLRPYPGLHVEGSKWLFVDEVEYNKDAYTVQLKVRYSHDSLRDTRRHVVMVDRQNPDKVVTYDEVTTLQDPANPTNQYDEPVLYVTNYVEESTADDDTTDGIGLSRSRRLRAADDMLLTHMRRKIAGFPDIFVHDAVVGYHLDRLPDHAQRRLATDDDDYDDLDDIVTLTSTVTTTNANALMDVTNTTDAQQTGAMSSDTATLMEDQLLGAVTRMPCQILNLTYSDDALPPNLAEPEATFGGLTIETLDGLIQWPSASAVVDIADFNDVPIVHLSLIHI